MITRGLQGNEGAAATALEGKKPYLEVILKRAGKRVSDFNFVEYLMLSSLYFGLVCVDIQQTQTRSLWYQSWMPLTQHSNICSLWCLCSALQNH